MSATKKNHYLVQSPDYDWGYAPIEAASPKEAVELVEKREGGEIVEGCTYQVWLLALPKAVQFKATIEVTIQ